MESRNQQEGVRRVCNRETQSCTRKNGQRSTKLNRNNSRMGQSAN